MKINEKIEKKLKELGIEKSESITKADFTEILFQLIDPVEDKVIKEYSFLESEFNDLPYVEKRKFSKLKKSLKFNEKAYKEENKKQNKIEKNYIEKYKEVLKEKGYSEKDYKKYQTLLSLMVFHFDIDEIDKDAEEDFLEFLKSLKEC